MNEIQKIVFKTKNNIDPIMELYRGKIYCQIIKIFIQENYIIPKIFCKIKKKLTPLSLRTFLWFPGNGNQFPFKKIYKIIIYTLFYGNQYWK